MTVGFLMLVHGSLERASEVAVYWARAGCPVMIHVDARVPDDDVERFSNRLRQHPNIQFSARRDCHWGTWSIVGATLDGARRLLQLHPEVRHVFLTCGTSLPLRPVVELQSLLDANPDTDFVESVTTRDVSWTKGGLDHERFTLSFPFAWKGQRRAFDLWVKLQRRMGRHRRIPEGIEPHLGSQWWCLTRETLERIMSDPAGQSYARYFRRVWIPDESYFQTVVRLYARRLESRSLTLAKFDFQGKPHVFYDDHLDLLRGSDCFVARKIWPRASALYDHFLNASAGTGRRPDPAAIDRRFAKALEKRTRGRGGLYMQSRFPYPDWENGKSAAPYSVFEGFAELFEDWPDWLARLGTIRVHGHLYAPERADFADGQTEFAGALSDIASLRDYNPVAFLTNLVWSTRGERQCFSFGPSDNQEITTFVASDPNAHVSVISGAWLVPLWQSGLPPEEARQRAAELQATEALHLDILRRSATKARVRTWTLSEFLDAPGEVLRTVQGDLAPRPAPGLVPAPRMVDLSGFPDFLQELRNRGMLPHIAGDLGVMPQSGAPKPAAPRIAR